MKKILYMAAAAALMAASCTSNDIMENDMQRPAAQVPISFSTYNSSVRTRGVETTIGNLQGSGFEVLGICADSVMMQDMVWYNEAEDKFASELTYYWPAADLSGTPAALDFYAIYASNDFVQLQDNAISYDTTAKSVTSPFTLMDPCGYSDIVVAKAMGQTATANGKVALSFKHILGEMTLALDSVEKDKYEYRDVEVSIDYIESGIYDHVSGTITPGDEMNTTAWENNEDEPYLFFIPGEVTMTVQYKVFEKNASDATTAPTPLMDFTGDNAKTAQVTLQGGKRTNVTLALPSGVTPVKISTQVGAWENASDMGVTVPTK